MRIRWRGGREELGGVGREERESWLLLPSFCSKWISAVSILHKITLVLIDANILCILKTNTFLVHSLQEKCRILPREIMFAPYKIGLGRTRERYIG